MRNLFAIYWKEMRSYFGSPVAYVMAAVFLFFTGYMFQNLVFEFHQMSRYYQQGGVQHQRGGMNANDLIVTDFYSFQFFVWLIVTPMLTMRLYAEEQRQGTFELLMTSPVTAYQVLVGKFLACFSLYAIIEVGAVSLLGVLSYYALVEWGPILSALLAALLLGSTFISVGIFASSLTENQIVAVVISFFLLLFLWFIDWSSRFVDPLWGSILRYLSIVAHMEDMNRGVIDTMDIAFFLSLTALFMFLTHTVIESRRWRV